MFCPLAGRLSGMGTYLRGGDSASGAEGSGFRRTSVEVVYSPVSDAPGEGVFLDRSTADS